MEKLTVNTGDLEINLNCQGDDDSSPKLKIDIKSNKEIVGLEVAEQIESAINHLTKKIREEYAPIKRTK